MRGCACWCGVGVDWRRCDCLLYTSDAADERIGVYLGGRRLYKKKTAPNYYFEGTSMNPKRKKKSKPKVQKKTKTSAPTKTREELPIPLYVVFLLFMLSGFTALIYESIWSKYLTFLLGYSASGQSLILVQESD